MSSQDLRDRLQALPPDLEAPADLVERVRATATHHRRARVSVMTAAVVLLVAMPLVRYALGSDGGIRGDRATDPAASPSTQVVAEDLGALSRQEFGLAVAAAQESLSTAGEHTLTAAFATLRAGPHDESNTGHECAAQVIRVRLVGDFPQVGVSGLPGQNPLVTGLRVDVNPKTGDTCLSAVIAGEAQVPTAPARSANLLPALLEDTPCPKWQICLFGASPEAVPEPCLVTLRQHGDVQDIRLSGKPSYLQFDVQVPVRVHMTGDCPLGLWVSAVTRAGRNLNFRASAGQGGVLAFDPGDTHLALVYQPCAQDGAYTCRGPNATKLFPLFFYT